MITDIQYTPDTLEVVTLAKAKKQLRIESDFNDEDTLIQGYIDAAVAHCENFIGGHIIPKSMVIKLDAFDSLFEFSAYPLKSVTSVKYYTAETETTLDASKYALTQQSDKVFKLRFKEDTPATEERFDAVTIEVAVGFPGDVIPKPIIQAILLQVSEMYEFREDRAEQLSKASMTLLRPYKKY